MDELSNDASISELTSPNSCMMVTSTGERDTIIGINISNQSAEASKKGSIGSSLTYYAFSCLDLRRRS